MTRSQCKLGCTNPKTRRPMFHDHEYDCPLFKGERPTMENGPLPSTPGPAPPPSPARTPPASGTPPLAAKKGLLQKLGFGNKVATIESSAATPQNQVVTDFYIDQAHTIELWNIGSKVGKFLTDSLDDWLEIAHIPDKFFMLSEFEKRSIEENLKDNWFTRGGTWLMKRFGAKTREEAHGYIDGLAFFSHFGGLFAVIFRHYQLGIKKSPMLARRKMAAAERAAKRTKDSTPLAFKNGMEVVGNEQAIAGPVET